MDEKRTPGGQSVTAAVYADRARSWAIALEEDEAATRGLDRVEDARAYVARRTGVPAALGLKPLAAPSDGGAP